MQGRACRLLLHAAQSPSTGQLPGPVCAPTSSLQLKAPEVPLTLLGLQHVRAASRLGSARTSSLDTVSSSHSGQDLATVVKRLPSASRQR